MTRIVHREMPDMVMRAAHLYLNARLSEAEARQAKGDRKHGPYSILAAHCKAAGVKDEKGSYTLLFPRPVIIGGKTYTGVRLQASQPASYWDEERAQALITSLGDDAVAAATHTEIVWDLDMLFLFLQQGRITAEALDDVLIRPPAQYSLTVLEGTA
jgi:hypothetical protein